MDELVKLCTPFRPGIALHSQQNSLASWYSVQLQIANLQWNPIVDSGIQFFSPLSGSRCWRSGRGVRLRCDSI